LVLLSPSILQLTVHLFQVAHLLVEVIDRLQLAGDNSLAFLVLLLDILPSLHAFIVGIHQILVELGALLLALAQLVLGISEPLGFLFIVHLVFESLLLLNNGLVFQVGDLVLKVLILSLGIMELHFKPEVLVLLIVALFVLLLELLDVLVNLHN